MKTLVIHALHLKPTAKIFHKFANEDDDVVDVFSFHLDLFNQLLKKDRNVDEIKTFLQEYYQDIKNKSIINEAFKNVVSSENISDGLSLLAHYLVAVCELYHPDEPYNVVFAVDANIFNPSSDNSHMAQLAEMIENISKERKIHFTVNPIETARPRTSKNSDVIEVGFLPVSANPNLLDIQKFYCPFAADQITLSNQSYRAWLSARKELKKSKKNEAKTEGSTLIYSGITSVSSSSGIFQTSSSTHFVKSNDKKSTSRQTNHKRSAATLDEEEAPKDSHSPRFTKK